MRGEDFALIDQPPNHCLFNYNSDTTKLTPLLHKRLEDAKTTNMAPNMTPTINFSIRKELVDLLRPPPALQAAAASADSLAPPVYTAPLLQNSFDIDCPTLLQANRKPGSDMTLEVFCATYQLNDAIRDHKGHGRDEVWGRGDYRSSISKRSLYM